MPYPSPSPSRNIVIKILFILTVLLIHKLSYFAFGLLCYTCSYTEDDEDNACLLNPVELGEMTNCTKKYCTIVRQEAVSPAGKVISFLRDCQDNPLFLNAIKTDPTFKTYYRSCVMDLCNDSDGIQAAQHTDPNFGAAENTVIVGLKNVASNGKVSNFLHFLCAIIGFELVGGHFSVW